MRNVNDITREQWLQECFPEWGRWLIEDIESCEVKPGTFTAWWLGCTGIWIKSEGNCNVCVDLYSGVSKTTHYKWPEGHRGPNFQLGRIAGSNGIHMNPRNIPHVMDPFQIKDIDVFMATHDHADHMDMYSTAAVLKIPGVPFVGPKFSADKWRGWGVPEDRIIEVKPGDVLNFKDIEIVVLDSFDRTALVTAPPLGSIVGRFPGDMDERAVNYLIKTPGGSFYHSGDSHFSDYTLRHGKMYDIDVAIAAFGENPKGISDKITASDVLRMADNLGCKVMIPVHYDIWPTFYTDPNEIKLLYDYKKDMMEYKFNLYIWAVGGKFTYPTDAGRKKYSYPRGFDDAMENEPNIPFKSFL